MSSGIKVGAERQGESCRTVCYFSSKFISIIGGDLPDLMALEKLNPGPPVSYKMVRNLSVNGR